MKTNPYAWNINNLAKTFIGKLVEVVNTNDQMHFEASSLVPVNQVEKGISAQLGEVAERRLKGVNNDWRYNFDWVHATLKGERIRKLNPVFVVDVVRDIVLYGEGWKLIVLANEQYYLVNITDVVLCESLTNE